MKRRLVRHISRALIFIYMIASANVHGATADLASVPLVTSSTSAVLPNLMFILDDSGSMDWDYLPDWANSSNDSLFRNNDYNGVAYTAAVTYSPPVYYNSDGSLNTTTYPSQTSANTSAFAKVKNDGYGIQSTSTSDLTSSAFFYTFIPGEYCSDVKLRTCVNQSAASVAYPFPAKLRWCTNSSLTTCQAVRIEEGSTLYTNARTAGGAANSATVTISGSSSHVISGITVNEKQIMSAATASSGTTTTVASRTVTAINNCTAAITGACTIAGYSASRSGSVVTIVAPAAGGIITYTPVVTQTGTGSAAVTAFVAGTGGENRRTDIVSGTNSYPYPGTSVKASTRSDCAGTTCTYAEEMTNYANWWAYYHTRMQMMKTASSLAFKDIGAKYRIGFDTINGNTSGFLNISTFDTAQKLLWYNRFFAAVPNNSTPLRNALSDIGRLYAGKLNGATHNGATVVDPVQYSCQQNFTILSTDGYWNGGAGFKIDGSAFGSLNPDGSEIRPFNDGATAVVTSATPTVTVEKKTTVQNVSVSTPWQRTVTTVGAACTTASSGTTPTSCTFDNGNWRANTPASNGSDVRLWCMTPNTPGNASDCVSLSGVAGSAFTGTGFACRNQNDYNTSPPTGGTACRTDSSGQNWCIYKGNSVGTSCIQIPGFGPSTLAVSSRMYACIPPVASVSGNQLTTAIEGYTQVQTGTVTTVQSVTSTSTSTVTTTNGVSAPAVLTSSSATTTDAGYPQTVMAADNPAINTDDPPSGSPPWATVSSSTACTASAAASTGAATSGTVVTTNVGGAATPVTTPFSGPTQGTPVVTSTSTGGVLDTLADVAEYYYATDLRDSSLSNCTGVPIPPATTGLDVCGASTTADLLQRMVTFTLGLGVSGQMQYSPTYSTATSGDFFDVKNGTAANGSSICIWQASGACNWPAPASDSQKAVDDLWHAAVNGRGQYFSATNPASLSSGLASALAGVNAQLGSSAAATTSNPNVTSGDNFVFSTTFNTGVLDKGGWDGQLVRNQLNLVTGIVSSTDDWEARSQLNANTSRVIYTFDSTETTKLKLFNWTNVSANTTQKAYFEKPAIAALSQFCSAGATCLTAADQTLAEGQSLVNYIRGDRTNEGISTDVTKYYRVRSHVLGDIVNAEAVYVKTPLVNYADTGFSAYVSDQASRQGMVYAAGNDGMLHAFNASTGAEAWAYIPTMVLPNLYKLADKNYAALHQFYVDGTPVAGEVLIGGVWKTILVGGLNNGGRGYYALDVTDPAAPKALWEFTNDNLGYTYGNPIITKLYDGHGTGQWVVLVTSGYNNVVPGDGVGRLFVLDAATGAQVSTIPAGISTGAGSTTTPSGLSKINAWVEAGSTDNTTLRVYGGDLLGNLWRFDINDLYGTSGYDAHRLVTAYANTAGTITQSFTAKPELGEVSGKAVVLAGTGRFLGATDLTDATVQSFYAVKDKLDSTSYSNPKATGSGFIKQEMSETTCPSGTPTSVCTTGQTVRVSINEQAVNFANDNGWYLDLIGTRERANTDPTLALGTLGFTTNLPNTSACTAGGTSFRYFLDYTKGTPVSTARASGSGVGVIGVSFGNALATRGVFVRLPNNTVVQLTRLSTGATVTSNVPIGSGSASTRRVSWRELISE